MDNSKKEGGIVQLVVVLGLITFICALLLGVINGVTADKITQNGIETRNAAMAEIIPDADFEDLDTALSAEDVAAAGVTLPAGRCSDRRRLQGNQGRRRDRLLRTGRAEGLRRQPDDDRRHQCGRHRCRRKGNLSR